MRERKPVLGLCPIGKFVFSHEDAVRYKLEIEKRLRVWDVPYVGIDAAVPDGVVRGLEHVEAAVRCLREARAEALFLPHCNFGSEHATGLIGQALGLPTLLWGPRDETPLPDGTRLRDSLCGLFASSKVLRKLRVPFSYIENCRLDDPPLREGLETFLRAAATANVFRQGIKIGQVGQRIDFFWTTIINESELLERLNVQVLPIDLIELIERVKQRAVNEEAGYQQRLAELEKTVTLEGFEDRAVPRRLLALADDLIELAQREGLAAFAVQSFMSICNQLGGMVELAMALVADAGYPVACETDIHGAISSVLLQRASFDTEPIFLADFTIRHPANENGILFWHCSAPLSLRKPEAPASVGPHWILPGIPPGSCHWQLRDGNLTVARFDGDGGHYQLAVGAAQTIEGPWTQNTYVWAEVADWPRWERKLIQGPFIHHTAVSYGNYVGALLEACRFVPGLEPQPLDG